MVDIQVNGVLAHDQPPARSPDVASFDIVACYKRLLAEDEGLTMPMAAIESLIECLSQSNATTVYEIMELIQAQAKKLEVSIVNSIALSHGTYLFHKYLILKFQESGPNGRTTANKNDESFEVLRQYLVKNGRRIAERAKSARERIAINARAYIDHDYTILTHGSSRAVKTLLERAAEKHDYGHKVDGPLTFKVIYVTDPDPDAARQEQSKQMVAALRAKDVMVATIPPHAVSYVMNTVDLVIVGAEAVTFNGGVISGLGTFQLAQLARQNGKRFYVAAEQHKFGKTTAFGQTSYTFDQAILQFRAADEPQSSEARRRPIANPIDFTPPALVDSFFSDHKVVTPAEVAKEVLDLQLL